MNPQKARDPIAHQILLLKPNEHAEIELPINPSNNTGRLPCLSEYFPNCIAVQSCAKKKMEAKIIIWLSINLCHFPIPP